jgi:hypothetical protein
MKFYRGKNGAFYVYPLLKVGNFTFLCIEIRIDKNDVKLSSYDESQLRMFSYVERKLNAIQRKEMIKVIMSDELIREMSFYL